MVERTCTVPSQLRRELVNIKLLGENVECFDEEATYLSLLTLTNVPVRLVPSPLLSASSSINSAIDFLMAVISTALVLLMPVAASAFTTVAPPTVGEDEEYERARNTPEAAAGAAYRVPNRVAAVNI